MASIDQSLENVIKKNFPNEIQQKRVTKEIQTLRELNQKWYKISLQSTNLGLKIIVEVTKEYVQKEVSEALKQAKTTSILFEIILEPKFPFVFPKITCRTKFIDPTIADGRDYVNDILGKVWSPAILLREIVVLIPEFLRKVVKDQDDFVGLQKIGTYHLGHTYNLEDFLVLDNVAVFQGQEILVKSSKEAARYLVVTQMTILSFEPVNRSKNVVKLISWANIQSLISIKRKKEDEMALIFTWKDKTRKEGLTQIFLIDEAPQCVELIVDTMKKIGVKISRTIPQKPDLKLEEVTAANYVNMDINQIEDNISVLESKIQSDMSIVVINALTTLYQKAIEYYSAFNNEAFQNFVDKLHTLLGRADIQAVLNSNEQSANKKSSPGGRNRSENDDEEEEKKASSTQQQSGAGFGYGSNNMAYTGKSQEQENEDLFAIDDEDDNESPDQQKEPEQKQSAVEQTQSTHPKEDEPTHHQQEPAQEEATEPANTQSGQKTEEEQHKEDDSAQEKSQTEDKDAADSQKDTSENKFEGQEAQEAEEKPENGTEEGPGEGKEEKAADEEN